MFGKNAKHVAEGKKQQKTKTTKGVHLTVTCSSFHESLSLQKGRRKGRRGWLGEVGFQDSLCQFPGGKLRSLRPTQSPSYIPPGRPTEERRPWKLGFCSSRDRKLYSLTSCVCPVPFYLPVCKNCIRVRK